MAVCWCENRVVLHRIHTRKIYLALTVPFDDSMLLCTNTIFSELTGDFTPDVKQLEHADVIVTTPEKWDGISRHWQHRSYVTRVGLVVIDEIHLLGQDRGPVLEV